MQEGIKVKNRDIIALNNIHALMQECVSLEKRAQFTQDMMYSLTRRITGMPGAKGGTPKGFESAYANMDEIHRTSSDRMQEYYRELKRMEPVINSIPSEKMRAFVIMMYIDELPFETVKTELNMTRRGFDRARMAVEQAENMREAARRWKEKFIFSEK